MNRKTAFARKIAYLCVIVIMLFPLFWLGRPSVRSSAGEQKGGGMLSEMRRDMGLSQAELGEIDPASESMKLATLGLRGIATSILWQRSAQYKQHENWDKFAATLNTIRRLTPNYISVWEYQAWNLSYNVSTEFDFYKHRYSWVTRGIDYLMDGTRYNERNPRLLWNLGWSTGQKLGRADEHRQFRVLYRVDSPLHERMAEQIRMEDARDADGDFDNWLTSHLWFLRAQDVDGRGLPGTWLLLDINKNGISNRKRSSVVFYNDAPKALVNYASTITTERMPGEITRRAWNDGYKAMYEFGDRDVPTTFGYTIRLNDLDPVGDQLKEHRRQLDELSDGARERLTAERRAKLTEAQREALDVPLVRQTEEQYYMAQEARQKIYVTDEEVFREVPPEKAVEGRRLLRLCIEAIQKQRDIAGYRNIVNFGYWLIRCDVEQQQDTIRARLLTREADRQKEIGNPEAALKQYNDAWEIWAKIMEAHPILVDDEMGQDLFESLANYETVLSQLDMEFPEDFPLKSLWTSYQLEVNPEFREQYLGAEDQEEEQPDDADPTGEGNQTNQAKDQDTGAGDSDAPPRPGKTGDQGAAAGRANQDAPPNPRKGGN